MSFGCYTTLVLVSEIHSFIFSDWNQSSGSVQIYKMIPDLWNILDLGLECKINVHVHLLYVVPLPFSILQPDTFI